MKVFTLECDKPYIIDGEHFINGTLLMDDEVVAIMPGLNMNQWETLEIAIEVANRYLQRKL